MSRLVVGNMGEEVEVPKKSLPWIEAISESTLIEFPGGIKLTFFTVMSLTASAVFGLGCWWGRRKKNHR